MTAFGTITLEDGLHTIRFERLLKFAREDVWAALTEPARLREWLAEAEVVPGPDGEISLDFGEGGKETGRITAWDPPLLRDFLLTRRVLRRPEAPWGLAPTDPAVERMLSLMAANSATHIIILSHDPVDLIVLAVPVISADPATETALALVRRLLALTPENV